MESVVGKTWSALLRVYREVCSRVSGENVWVHPRIACIGEGGVARRADRLIVGDIRLLEIGTGAYHQQPMV